MTGHPTRHGVDRVLHLNAPALEQIGELAHRVLGLGDREPVAGHDHHLAGVGQHDGQVVRGDLPHRLAVGSRRDRGRPRTVPAPNAEKRTFASERFIARLIRIVSSVPEAPTSDAADDQRVVVEHEAARGGGETRERVEERDDDGHVGAADRQDEQRRRRGAPARGGGPSTHRPRCAPAATAQPSAATSTKPLTTCWAGNVIGDPVISSWSFAKAIRLPVRLIEPISAENRIAAIVSPETDLAPGPDGGTPPPR